MKYLTENVFSAEAMLFLVHTYVYSLRQQLFVIFVFHINPFFVYTQPHQQQYTY